MPASLAVDETARQILINALGPEKGRIIYDYAQTRPLAERHGVYQHFARRIALKAGHVVPPYYKAPPVSVETFCRDPYYLGMGDELYPTLVPHLEAINSGSYVEAVLTGGYRLGQDHARLADAGIPALPAFAHAQPARSVWAGPGL